MALNKRKKGTVIKKSARHESDTGSPEVQIGVLTKKIDELAAHLKKHRQDTHSRRGLLSMVADRRAHMRYLKDKDEKKYEKIAKELGLKSK